MYLLHPLRWFAKTQLGLKPHPLTPWLQVVQAAGQAVLLLALLVSAWAP